ncbi:Protein of unknown function, partial [Gryllus bimaculatus]
SGGGAGAVAGGGGQRGAVPRRRLPRRPLRAGRGLQRRLHHHLLAAPARAEPQAAHVRGRRQPERRGAGRAGRLLVPLRLHRCGPAPGAALADHPAWAGAVWVRIHRHGDVPLLAPGPLGDCAHRRPPARRRQRPTALCARRPPGRVLGAATGEGLRQVPWRIRQPGGRPAHGGAAHPNGLRGGGDGHGRLGRRRALRPAAGGDATRLPRHLLR